MQRRDELILQEVNRLGRISVTALASQFAVAVETIRRDLTALEKKGLVYRVHGGAVSKKTKDLGSSFQVRQRSHYEAKRQIAQHAVEYVFEGAVIGLDASSTSWHFAQLIPDIPCTVVTNSMHNITALVNKPNIKTIATGGVYSSKYDAFYGPLSEQLLQRLHIDIGIFSCIGIDNTGAIWESNELNASIKRKMMDASGQKFLLVDASKFGQKNLIKWAELSQIDILFCDQPPEQELQSYCVDHDILLTV
ncbi:DeoR/GlpR family DNA-binding transcription regulator [Pasteurella multocida]|uniref:DeoR/GlpR family DNA-binding transcription regulator n=1 Tax=Pasteurella multocida TaxID=747 RepID=UPI0009F1EDCF|nr:DeoR/GlpR family DNA-binding transcription regulator [Pasteurella multocida]AWB52644.1 DeoR/GlpR transcriptional regulator [Pasteurella multocida]MCL7787313.1 DeoR/GlpR family DNA-binding transcription regulator [Pasteurella multocida]MCL7794359.1 DeoR/GlpR family DNA-binding transcription regulator [Pasteurella multocida]MCL7819051.1 DeoR/GlpR family DNA-binding transcription regulator [Pasteurella multocida]MDT8767243.1 DeoR/GlpR family DNA-binding transcription regulator [Pasteurella mul